MNYQPNSHKSKAASEKPAKKEVEQITHGSVTKRKKPLGKRITETFTGEDAQSVGNFILFEVVIPQLKTLFADAVTQGVERKLFGDSRGTSKPLRSPSSYTSYNRMSYSSSSNHGREEPRTLSNKARANHQFNELVVESRAEATDVIDRLRDLIGSYDTATVSDLYALVGITGNFVDEKWGWTDLRSAGVHRVRNGFLLQLPPPIYLE